MSHYLLLANLGSPTGLFAIGPLEDEQQRYVLINTLNVVTEFIGILAIPMAFITEIEKVQGPVLVRTTSEIFADLCNSMAELRESIEANIAEGRVMMGTADGVQELAGEERERAFAAMQQFSSMRVHIIQELGETWRKAGLVE